MAQPVPTERDMLEIQQGAWALIASATRLGIVVTIDHRVTPLNAGLSHYKVDARAARGSY